MKRSQLICIIGPDGVGKTTQAKLLLAEFEKRNIKCEYKWLRFRHRVSLPLMACARLMGLSEIKTKGKDIRISYHYYYKSEIVSSLYIISLYLDTLFSSITNISIPRKLFKINIICDRFICDTVVDLIMSTKRYDILNSWIGNSYFALIPKDCKFFLLIADEETLRKRREDIIFDDALQMKIQLYKKISDKLNIQVIDASLPSEKIQELIVQEILDK